MVDPYTNSWNAVWLHGHQATTIFTIFFLFLNIVFFKPTQQFFSNHSTICLQIYWGSKINILSKTGPEQLAVGSDHTLLHLIIMKYYNVFYFKLSIHYLFNIFMFVFIKINPQFLKQNFVFCNHLKRMCWRTFKIPLFVSSYMYIYINAFTVSF